MASIHIPLLMDGKPLKRLRNRGLTLDGSFRLPASALEDEAGRTLVLDHYKDADFRAGTGPTDFVTLVSPERIKAMMRAGYRYAKKLHEEGQLALLQPIARDRFGHDAAAWGGSHQRQPPPQSQSQSQTGVETIYSGGGGRSGLEGLVDGGVAEQEAGDEGPSEASGLRARL